MDRKTMADLSTSGRAVLVQLHGSPVWDGDVISKEGRNELVSLGLAQRLRRDEQGLAINELTEAGRQLCADAIEQTDAAFAMAVKSVTGPTQH